MRPRCIRQYINCASCRRAQLRDWKRRVSDARRTQPERRHVRARRGYLHAARPHPPAGSGGPATGARCWRPCLPMPSPGATRGAFVSWVARGAGGELRWGRRFVDGIAHGQGGLCHRPCHRRGRSAAAFLSASGRAAGLGSGTHDPRPCQHAARCPRGGRDGIAVWGGGSRDRLVSTFDGGRVAAAATRGGGRRRLRLFTSSWRRPPHAIALGYPLVVDADGIARGVALGAN